MRQDFVANASHELKTPLASIKAYTETLLDWALHDDSVNVRFLERIDEQAERLNQLILDLLSLARLESGQEIFDHQPLEVVPVLESCVESLRGRAAAKNLALTFDADGLDERTLILADEEAVRQIADNLIDNAIKYTPENGSVHVSCSLRDDTVVHSSSPTPGSASPARTCPGSSSASTALTRPAAASWAGPAWASRSSSTWSNPSAGRIDVTSRVGSGSQFTVRFPRLRPRCASPRARRARSRGTPPRPHDVPSALPIEGISSRIHTIFILVYYTGCPLAVESSLAQADRRGRGRCGTRGARSGVCVAGSIARGERRPNERTGKHRMSDVRALVVRVGLASLLGMTAGCGGGGTGRGGGADSRPRRSSWTARARSSGSARRRRADSRKWIPPCGSPSTSMAPAGVSPDTSRTRLTSSMPRGWPSPTRRSEAREQGIDWTRFVVGYDGITLVVNPKNDFVRELTVDQLKAIWAPDSKVKTWKDVDPAWPDRKIILYSPDNDSGTFEFFTEAIVGKARSQRDGVQQNSVGQFARAGGRRRRRTGWVTSAMPTTRRTRTSCGPWPSATARTRSPSSPARRRSRTRAMPRCRGRCSST